MQAAVLNPHQWVALYADYLYNYAFTRLGNEEQARDLVQETFLAALERTEQFKGNSSERTWLTAILKYKIIDVYRKRNSGLHTERIEGEPEREFFETDSGHWKAEYAPRAFGGGAPDTFGVEDPDLLTNKELRSVLQNCLQKLPALWLSVFTMKHIDEEATAVICEALKVTPSNFWVIIHRAKINLRACIQKAWA